MPIRSYFAALYVYRDPAARCLGVYFECDFCSFGKLDETTTSILGSLIEGSYVRIQAIVLLPLQPRVTRLRQVQRSTVDIILNLYGKPGDVNAVGIFLSDNKIFLQHPKYPQPGFIYKNPHLFSKRFDGFITQATVSGGVELDRQIPDAPVLASMTNTVHTTDVLSFFNNLFDRSVLAEIHGDSRLQTKLLK